MGVRNPFKIQMKMSLEDFKQFEFIRENGLSELGYILFPWRSAAYFEEFDTLPCYTSKVEGGIVEVCLAGHSKRVCVESVLKVCKIFSKSWVFFIATDDGECAQFYYSGIDSFKLEIPQFFNVEVKDNNIISYENHQEFSDSEIVGVESYEDSVMTSKLKCIDDSPTFVGWRV